MDRQNTSSSERTKRNQKKCEKRDQRDAWAKTLRRCEAIVMKANAGACRVFLALKSHVDLEGYCWPLIATLQRDTGIKKRDTVTEALRGLESMGILGRACMVSKRGGSRAPDLYRIGGKVERLPINAAKYFSLGATRIKKSPMSTQPSKGPHPEKGGVGRSPTHNPRHPEKGEGGVPKKGVGRHPEKRGIELLHGELPHGKNHETPNLACPVVLRQDHAIAAIHVEPQHPGSGGSAVLSLAVIQQTNPSTPVPPVIAYLQKHGKLPEYIVDETHLCLDLDGNYAGYIDRDGKRRDAWNNFESIEMAWLRRSNETYRENVKILQRYECKEDPPPEPTSPVNGEEKLRMLRQGASSEAEAEEWSACTGIPAHIFLPKDPYERERLFCEWRKDRQFRKITETNRR